VDLRWDAGGHTHAEWQAFAQQAFIVDEGDATLTLREVADRHGGEVWLQFAGDGEADEQVYFRMLLPVATAPNAAPAPVAAPDLVPATLESRPEYYDFDLFHQLGQRPELDAQPLRSLTYTVFDTETTGLDPRHDTIISIGAVRIVNGRVLRQEMFDQLIDPERPIPRVATEVHGIDDAMVADEPSIEQVLPRFARFAEATVLVAHNAAFDMRMLQQQEAATGARFINPVL
ncbi:MAG: 3'-5' exonuclease, partial [Anaerolineae bacterium]|nr:3'-5' exonuclease [Anaerolineae bacterium]